MSIIRSNKRNVIFILMFALCVLFFVFQPSSLHVQIQPTPLDRYQSTITTLDPLSIPSGYTGFLVYLSGGIQVLNLETGERLLFGDVGGIAFPRWNPNGQQIAFGFDGIKLLDLATGEVIRLNVAGDYSLMPSWRPDGVSLVYTVNAGYNQGLYSMNVSTLEVQQIPIEGSAYHTSWSPDGERIAFALSDGQSNDNINIIDADCILSAICHPIQLTTMGDRNYSPSWSPNGERIAFVSNRDGYWAIYVMNADGSGQQQLTQSALGLGDFYPVWSPDGRYIAFVRNERFPDNSGDGFRQIQNIFIMRPNGSEITQITFDGATELDWWMDLSDSEGGE